MQGAAITHLSVRVPWQDTRWDGRVCADPSNNQSCVVLKAIAENRNDAKEDGCRGKWISSDAAVADLRRTADGPSAAFRATISTRRVLGLLLNRRPSAVGSPADLRRAVREIRGRLLLSAAWSVPFHHHDSHRRLLLGRRRPDFLIADMTMLLFHESSTRYIRKRFDSGVHEWKQIGYVDGLALWAKSFREIHHNL
jgi:hypothetical protein